MSELPKTSLPPGSDPVIANLSLSQTASLMGVSRVHVRSLILSGALAAVNVSAATGPQQRWRISRQAIEDFQRARQNVQVTPVVGAGAQPLPEEPAADKAAEPPPQADSGEQWV